MVLLGTPAPKMIHSRPSPFRAEGFVVPPVPPSSTGVGVQGLGGIRKVCQLMIFHVSVQQILLSHSSDSLVFLMCHYFNILWITSVVFSTNESFLHCVSQGLNYRWNSTLLPPKPPFSQGFVDKSVPFKWLRYHGSYG